MRKVGLTPKYEHFARPYLHELLNSLAEDYDFAIWSQTGMSGIIRKLTALQVNLILLISNGNKSDWKIFLFRLLDLIVDKIILLYLFWMTRVW